MAFTQEQKNRAIKTVIERAEAQGVVPRWTRQQVYAALQAADTAFLAALPAIRTATAAQVVTDPVLTNGEVTNIFVLAYVIEKSTQILNGE